MDIDKVRTDLRQQGKFRAETAATLAEATAQLRRDVVRLVTAGDISELEASKLTGLSRSTIRLWLGKN